MLDHKNKTIVETYRLRIVFFVMFFVMLVACDENEEENQIHPKGNFNPLKRKRGQPDVSLILNVVKVEPTLQESTKNFCNIHDHLSERFEFLLNVLFEALLATHQNFTNQDYGTIKHSIKSLVGGIPQRMFHSVLLREAKKARISPTKVELKALVDDVVNKFERVIVPSTATASEIRAKCYYYSFIRGVYNNLDNPSENLKEAMQSGLHSSYFNTVLFSEATAAAAKDQVGLTDDAANTLLETSRFDARNWLVGENGLLGNLVKILETLEGQFKLYLDSIAMLKRTIAHISRESNTGERWKETERQLSLLEENASRSLIQWSWTTAGATDRQFVIEARSCEGTEFWKTVGGNPIVDDLPVIVVAADDDSLSVVNQQLSSSVSSEPFEPFTPGRVKAEDNFLTEKQTFFERNIVELERVRREWADND